MKKRIVLFIFLAVLCAAVCALGENTLTVGSPAAGEFPGNNSSSDYYSFRPTVYGPYRFTLTSENHIDRLKLQVGTVSSTEVSDGKIEIVALCDPYDNYGATVSLTYRPGDGAIAYQLEAAPDDGIYVVESKDEWIADYDGSCRLFMPTVSSHTAVSYQWGTVGEGNVQIPLEGRTGPRFTVTHAKENKTYYCAMTNTAGTSKTVFFSLQVYTGLDLQVTSTYPRINNNKYVVDPTGGCLLEVSATNHYGDISYQWYRGEGILEGADPYRLEGKTGTTCFADPDVGNTTYVCEATDVFGNKKWVTMPVVFENHLRCPAVTAAGPDGSGQVTLTAAPTCDSGDLSYQWYHTLSSGAMVPAEGATESTYTETLGVGKVVKFKCEVTDRYGNKVESPIKEISRYNLKCELSSSCSGYAYSGMPVEVTARVTADDRPTVFKWYRKDTEDGEFQLIEGETGEKLTLPGGLTNTAWFRCEVENTHASAVSEDLKILYTDGSTVCALGSTYRSIYPNETFTLQVFASNPEDYTFQWYRGDDPIENQTGQDCTINDVESGTVYFYCKIYRDNTIWTTYNYTVSVNGYIDCRPGSRGVDVENGKATMTVWVPGSAGRQLSYQWYAMSGLDGIPVEGANTDTYTAEPSGYSSYECLVSDGYGNSNRSRFTVMDSVTLQANPASSTIETYPGAEITMGVEAACPSNVLSYRWYRKEKNAQKTLIEGANQATLTVSDVYQATDFECDVTSGFGWTGSASWSVKVDNELTVPETNREITIQPGQSPVLDTEAQCKNADALTVRWYESSAATNYTQQLIDGAAGTAYTPGALTREAYYICQIADDNRTSYSVTFHVQINNNLEATADGSAKQTVHAGETIQLAVDASCTVGGLHYQWYYMPLSSFTSISGAESGTLDITYNDEYKNKTIRYLCKVQDDYTLDNCGQPVIKEVEFSVLFQPVPADCPELAPGASVSAGIEAGKNQYYRFTPASTACYTLTAEPDKHAMMSITVSEADSGKTVIASQVYSLQYDVQMEKGKTYHIGVGFQNSNTSGSIALMLAKNAENRFIQADGETALTVHYGESADLAVKAGPDPETLPLQWVRMTEEGLAEEIDGANGTAYRTPAIIRQETYRCYLGNDYASFTVTPSGTLTAEAKDGKKQVTGIYHQPLELEVTVNADSTDLTYCWYTFSSGRQNRIAGADTCTLAIPEATGADYRCIVSDNLGNSAMVDFTVEVTDSMKLSPVGETTRHAKAGDSITLEVAPTSAEGAVRYEWSEWYKANNIPESFSMISGAKAASCTATVQGSGKIRCTAYDSLGNTDTVVFVIEADNDFWAKANYEAGVPADGREWNLIVSCYSDYDLSFTWYNFVHFKTDEATVMEGETTYEIKVAPLQENGSGYYRCHVSDASGNSRDVWFPVIANNLTVDAYNNTSLESRPGASVTMTTNASSSTGTQGITYTWYGPLRNRDDELTEQALVANATEKSLTVTPTFSPAYYVCIAGDAYGNTAQKTFCIIVRGQTIQAGAENTALSCTPGQSVDLAVNVTGSFGTVSFRWFRNDGQASYHLIQEGGNTCTVTPEKTTEYICLLSDDISQDTVISFTVTLQNNLAISNDGERTRQIAANEQAVLSVTASCSSGSISYQWYREVSDQYGNTTFRAIDGATANSYTVTDPTRSPEKFYCRVSDEYGGSRNSETFELTVRNDITVTPAEEHTAVVLYPTERTVLSVTATAQSGEVTYQWFIRNADTGEYSALTTAGSDKNTWTIESASEAATYKCVITDVFGNILNRFFDVTIDIHKQHEHVPETDAAVPPTCTQPGKTAGSHCSICGDVIDAQQDLPALGHELTHHEGENATCEAAGTHEYWQCTRDGCGRYFSDGTAETEIEENSWIIPAKGHAWGEVQYTWNSRESVTARRVCDNDAGHEETETVVPAVNRTAATCTTAGKITYTATFTRYPAFEPQTVTEDDPDASEPLGHSIIHHDAKAPTCTEPGWEAYDTCSRCDYTTYAEKAATGHSEAADAAVAATCTEPGKTAGSHCSVCGTVIKPQEDVPALGHEWSVPAYEWAEDYSKVTAKRTCGRNEEHTETEEAETTAEITPATTEADGKIVYTAVFTNPAFEKQTKEVILPKPETEIPSEPEAPPAGGQTDPEIPAEPEAPPAGGQTDTEPPTEPEAPPADGQTDPETPTDPEIPPAGEHTDPETGVQYEIEVPEEGQPTATYTQPNPENQTEHETIPDSITVNGTEVPVTAIAENAFKDNKTVESVTVGTNVETIGSGAFSGCSNLKSVNLGNSVETIGDNAFQGCTRLTKISIPEKTEQIGKNAFSGNTKLKTVTGGAGITVIGEGAFRKCTALAKITIGKNVTKIGKDAFNGCRKLKNITIQNAKLKKNSFGKNCFKDIYAKAVFKVPKKQLKNYTKWIRKPGGAPKTAKITK